MDIVPATFLLASVNFLAPAARNFKFRVSLIIRTDCLYRIGHERVKVPRVV